MREPVVGPEFAEGQRALQAGQPFSSNPHTIGEHGWYEWMKGWLAGWSAEAAVPGRDWHLSKIWPVILAAELSIILMALPWLLLLEMGY